MLPAFIAIYLVLSLAIGVYASRRVRNSSDFILAGQRLTMFLAISTEFATWFGSETVMGASAKISEEGLIGVIEDPFGASLCLILVGLLFARPLYRMKLLTFGDYYRDVFGRRAETVAAICLVLSYFGWVAAQMVAMGFVIHTVVPAVGITTGILVSSIVVIIYTCTGGLWAVSITDFIQSVFIVVGLLIAAIVVTGEAGGIGKVIDSAPQGFFRFFPEGGWQHWLAWIAAWMTIGLGSIPQQDVFQRVMASKTERIAVRSSYYAALLYLTVALLPLLLALAARTLLPHAPADSQLLLPQLILSKTGIVVQVLFFGALLSAIMSTASGALLAPAVILSENLIVPRRPDMTDAQRLRLTRWCVAGAAVVSLTIAALQRDIYELVGNASEISMVSLFIPLCAGLFFKSKNETAALASMLIGAAAWLPAVIMDTTVPPIIIGTAASLAGMILFSVLYKQSGTPTTQEITKNPLS